MYCKRWFYVQHFHLFDLFHHFIIFESHVLLGIFVNLPQWQLGQPWPRYARNRMPDLKRRSGSVIKVTFPILKNLNLLCESESIKLTV
jgi:hypothetical protein